MVIVESYMLAVFMCVITMLCWGSWANTQKLASREWRFELFYWDYAIGTLVIALIFALTMGSIGSGGRSFMQDLAQAGSPALVSAFLGGIVFNLANILIVAAIDLAGMAVAFPVGIGLALIIGVVSNYLAAPVGNAVLLFAGVGGITLAIVLDAVAYRRLPTDGRSTPIKGIVVAIVGGILMGFFYRFVAASMATDFAAPEAGMLTPYTAVAVFAVGLVASNFVWNTIIMYKPFSGEPVPPMDYFRKGTLRLHAVGILGGMIWGVGMSFSIIASGAAGFAISYGLGQGATMIGALWGVFIWREFKSAPRGTGPILGTMFLSYLVGLILIIVSRLA